MSAWKDLGLGPGVLDAIGQLGFGEPTPIQRECLLPAIRDRRDVIGAAQTVRARTCRHMPAHAPVMKILIDLPEAAPFSSCLLLLLEVVHLLACGHCMS